MTGLQFIELIVSDADHERRNKRIRAWSAENRAGSPPAKAILKALDDDAPPELHQRFCVAVCDALDGPKDDGARGPCPNTGRL